MYIDCFVLYLLFHCDIYLYLTSIFFSLFNSIQYELYIACHESQWIHFYAARHRQFNSFVNTLSIKSKTHIYQMQIQYTMKLVHFYCFYPLKSRFTICLLTAGHLAMTNFKLIAIEKVTHLKVLLFEIEWVNSSEFNARITVHLADGQWKTFIFCADEQKSFLSISLAYDDSSFHNVNDLDEIQLKLPTSLFILIYYSIWTCCATAGEQVSFIFTIVLLGYVKANVHFKICSLIILTSGWSHWKRLS